MGGAEFSTTRNLAQPERLAEASRTPPFTAGGAAHDVISLANRSACAVAPISA